MKSSKRKRCTTNEGTQLVNTALKQNELIATKTDFTNETADAAVAKSSLLSMFPDNQASSLIKDNNPYYRSDASSPLMFQHNKMEPPNNCLQQSYLMNSNLMTLKQQQFYSIENNKLNDTLNQQQQQPVLHFYNQTNIVAAKASSYYNLTPASSTTSLNDLTLYNNSNDLINKKLTKPKQVTLQRTSSKKRTRTITTENQPQQEQQIQEVASTTQRRRGRPPKNAAAKAALAVQEDIIEPKQVGTIQIEKQTATLQRYNSIDSSTLYAKQTNNKLIKSLINKCSSNSNLQKSKIAPNEPATEILANKVNRTNVNTKNNQPQPQITGYLVDNNNLKDSSDTENNQTICSAKTPVKAAQHSNGYNTGTEFPSTPMPKLNWADNNELWQVMRRKEIKFMHDPCYLKRHLNIEPQMRAILLDWLVEISYAYRLHRETWYLALEYMDRFLTCSKQQMRVDRLQLIGMTSLFLAAKVEEIYPPKLKELASHMESYSTDNEDAISQFELFMLKTLNWEISPVTANTWLMTYLQIASINYYSIVNQDSNDSKVHNTQIVMPLNIYKNSNLNKFADNNGVNTSQQQFYLENYMKSVALLDLCMFEMDSMRFSYSILAASAMYHMIAPLSMQHSNQLNKTPRANNQLAAQLVQSCTGYKLYELDACIKWMYPFADVCKDILTEEKMMQVKQFSNIDAEDCHNIQLYNQNLELLKEAQSRRTPSKFYSNSNLLLTPPDSHRKFSSSSSSSASSSYISDSNSLLSSHQTTILSTPSASNISK